MLRMCVLSSVEAVYLPLSENACQTRWTLHVPSAHQCILHLSCFRVERHSPARTHANDAKLRTSYRHSELPPPRIPNLVNERNMIVPSPTTTRNPGS